MQETGEKFIELLNIMTRLRAADGCPWDRAQTPETLKTYLIEEAYELLEALDGGTPDPVREELGDLLFLIVFLNHIHQERDLFTMTDVLTGISEKMIRRHPHVFGSTETDSEKKLKERWHQIKNREKAEKGEKTGVFTSIPKSLPALRKSQRISERAARVGFEWPDLEMALEKLSEEIVELQEALSTGSQENVSEELGDVLFILTCISRLAGVSAEDSLHGATVKFISRFTEMERLNDNSSRTFSDLDKQALLRLWEEAKKMAS